MQMYMVTHKGLDCKDELKLIKYNNYKVKLSLHPWILSLNGLFLNMAMKEPV